MKTIFLGIITLSASVAVAQKTCCAIRNINVIPMTSETILQDQTIIIEDGIITRTGPSGSTNIPENKIVIEGKNRYTIPGLFDMHAHFFEEQGNHKDTKEEELKVMLANGLTTVRIMAGHPNYLAAKENVSSKKWIGPEMFVVSPQFVGKWPWSPAFKNYEVVNSVDKARQAVARFKREGYDEIKLTFMIVREVYDAVIAAAKEHNIKVTGHVGPQVKLDAALAAGQQIEHMDEFIDLLLPDTSYNHGQSVSDMNIWKENAWKTVPYLDETKIDMLVEKVKQANISVTPTNYFFFSSFGIGMSDEEYKSKPDYRFIPEDLKKERWLIKEHYQKLNIPQESRERYVALRQKITRSLWEAGVPLMAGSDSPEWFLVQGFAIHDELKTFTDAGLTPYAALQTATVNTARYLDIDDKKGTIEPGKEADILILDKNPLENISNTRTINGIINNGVYYDTSSIDKMLKDAQAILSNSQE